jgi:hypothetical protein
MESRLPEKKRGRSCERPKSREETPKGGLWGRRAEARQRHTPYVEGRASFFKDKDCALQPGDCRKVVQLDEWRKFDV